MSAMPLLWIVWAGVTAIMLILLGYRGTLTRYEEDQIFLDDSFSHERTAQAAIVEKVNKIQPIVTVSMWLAAAATVGVVGFYIWDILNQFK